jgi:hypothetical protein
MNAFALKTCLIGLCFSVWLGATLGADKPAKEEDQSAKAIKERADAAARAGDAKDGKKAADDTVGKKPGGKDGEWKFVPLNDGAVKFDNLNPAEQQYVDRLKPMLKAELLFADRVCKLDKAQRDILFAAGEECVSKTAKQFANPQQGGQAGIRGGRAIIMFGGVQPIQAQSNRSGRDMLQQALSEAIKAKFPAETAATYANELTKRNDARKESVVECLVVMLDKRLILTALERREISQALLEHFDETWSGELGILMNNPQYFPQIPDDCLLPHLRDSQRMIWNSLPNKNVQFGIDTFDNDPITNLGIQVPDNNDDPFN